MNQQLNNLKEIMDRTVLKDGELSQAKKKEIFETAVHNNKKKKRFVFAPIVSVATFFCLLLIGGIFVTQFFNSEAPHITNSPDQQSLIIPDNPKQDNDSKTPTYEESVYLLPFQNYNSPVIDGNELFVHVHSDRNDHLDIDQFIQFDLETGEYKVLYESEYTMANMMNTEINEEWLLWQDIRMGGKLEKILAMNRETEEIKTIVEITGENDELRSTTLYDDYVAWIYNNHDTKETKVQLHNLLTGETDVIANMNYDEEAVPAAYIGEGKLLWTNIEDGEGFYYLYDLDNKNIDKIEAPYPYSIFVKYIDDNIYTTNSSGKNNNLTVNGLKYWDDLNYGYFDIETKEFHMINPDGSRGWFDAYDDKMLFLDTNKDLFVYEYQGESLVSSIITLNSGEEPMNAYFDSNGNMIIEYNVGLTEYDQLENHIKLGVVRPE